MCVMIWEYGGIPHNFLVNIYLNLWSLFFYSPQNFLGLSHFFFLTGHLLAFHSHTVVTFAGLSRKQSPAEMHSPQLLSLLTLSGLAHPAHPMSLPATSRVSKMTLPSYTAVHTDPPKIWYFALNVFSASLCVGNCPQMPMLTACRGD